MAPAGAITCASCGAALAETSDSAVPGLTAIDTESLIRGRVSTPKRTGLIPFLLGDVADRDATQVPSEAELASLEPPSTEVQLEIVRLELDAERVRLENAQAELAAEAAEAARDAAPAGSVAGDAPAVVSATEVTGPPPGPNAAAGAAATAPPPGPGTAATAATPEDDQPAG
ncbi:MAG TPA: hypothetical protein VK656_06195 [Candidatus Acidoferrum sp.]|nr:hypothetical protein [Candidatus Acidoferrum sp.]